MVLLLVLSAAGVLFGLVLASTALLSAIRTFVLPAGVSDTVSRRVFWFMRRVFKLRANRAVRYLERDRIMALYAPIAL